MTAGRQGQARVREEAQAQSQPQTRPKRLVVKIGSSTLTCGDNAVDCARIVDLANQVARLMNEGWQVVVVTSAAIAAGLGALRIDRRPEDIATLQAAASVGQCELTNEYARAFAEHGRLTSLVLLTRRDTADRAAYLNARAALGRLLDLGVVPIVNENDTVSVEQIRFGDNDTLAALVACLVGADLLVILSDIDGLYDANPKTTSDARLIPRVNCIDAQIMAACGGAGSVAGSGGMVTKMAAARVMMSAGIPMVIAHGRRANVVEDAVHGKDVGTMFEPRAGAREIAPRKLWIALGDAAHGVLVVDDGAHEALCAKGGSLLPIGIKHVEGAFDAGDIVDIAGADGFVFARGIAQAAKDEMELAAGKSSAELAANRLLAALSEKPAVHRDNLVVF